ncbi:unnamed protein product [Cylicostephanus goldi]|uniref:Uncharacterized protein n=1 Tax=Cylicostephanus goldi TaxID=71465 RepID=A0A3P6STL1_CYLGO|nr:unnamed protein product [Cylicostephanus goldi]
MMQPHKFYPSRHSKHSCRFRCLDFHPAGKWSI